MSRSLTAIERGSTAAHAIYDQLNDEFGYNATVLGNDINALFRYYSNSVILATHDIGRHVQLTQDQSMNVTATQCIFRKLQVLSIVV